MNEINVYYDWRDDAGQESKGRMEIRGQRKNVPDPSTSRQTGTSDKGEPSEKEK